MATEVPALPAQTFLTGTHVYLRPIEKSDAERSVAFRNTPYPMSPERTEEWMTDDLDESSKSFVYAIVRRTDDGLVGSVAFEREHYLTFEITGWVAPVFGAAGQRWKAEALTIASDWLSEELESPSVSTNLSEADTIVTEDLLGNGFVITSRLREKRINDGVRTGELTLTRFNRAWLETVGDPMVIELAKTGSGLARPVSVRIRSRTSAPKNAVMVGERVYLRPGTEADLEEDVLWQRRESETFHTLGRRLPSLAEFVLDVASDEEEDPLRYVFFSVCDIKTGTFIGEVGLNPVDYLTRTAETASWFHRPEFRG
ncbi:MAG: GNAT family N-acetyltransferase [Thermomicrobiales bacterium]